MGNTSLASVGVNYLMAFLVKWSIHSIGLLFYKQGSRWKALDNQTLCEEKVSEHHQEQPGHLHSPGKQLEAGNSDVDEQTPSCKALRYPHFHAFLSLSRVILCGTLN